jgi:hypothetical protein
MLCNAIGQQASLDGTKLLYRNFTSKSLTITSRGVGFTYRKAKFVRGKDRLFELELATIKDPKQVKTQGQGTNFKSYYFGKLNSVIAIRAGLGWQKSLYNKEVPTALEIKTGFAFGASIALLKPIYVQVPSNERNRTTRVERYDTTLINSGQVLGRASFFNGISKTTISPGAFLKYYFLFDFGSEDDKIRALECGAIGDFYLRGVNIMAFNTPRKFMLTLYVSYVFGDKKY